MTLLMLLLGCTQPPDFALSGAESGTLTGPGGTAALNGADMMKLDAVLGALRGRKVEVYSKPEYVLTFQTGGEERAVSFFFEERLVYPGAFNDAWTVRMSGRSVAGGKLDAGVVAILEQIALQ